jgi:hypothetical protein
MIRSLSSALVSATVLLAPLAVGCGAAPDDEAPGTVVETEADALFATCPLSQCPFLKLTSAAIEEDKLYVRDAFFSLGIAASGTSASDYQTSEAPDFAGATWKPVWVNGVRVPIKHTIAGSTGSKKIYVRVRGRRAADGSFVVSNALSDTVQFVERSVRVVNCADAFVQARSRGFTFTATNATSGGTCRMETSGSALRLEASGWLWDDANCTFNLFGGRRLRADWAIRSFDVLNTTGTTSFDTRAPLTGGPRAIPAFTSTERKKPGEWVPAYAWCQTLTLEGPVAEDTMMAFSDAGM